MQTETKVISITHLRERVAGRMEINGAEHDVRQVTAGVYQSLKGAAPSENMDAIIASVREVVPTLTPEEVAKLTRDQMEAILMCAGGGIERVEAMFPNAVGPETPISPA